MPSKESLGIGLTQEIRRVAEIPNAPFLYEPAKKYLREEISRCGFSVKQESKESSRKLEYAEDDFAFYVRIRSGQPKTKLMITGHLDHPYIVLDGKGGGVPLGTIGNERLKKLVDQQEVPINVFSKSGEKVAEDSIIGVNIGTRRSEIKTTYNQPYATNSHAIWNMDAVIMDEHKIKMLNSDNMVNTAIMLSLLKDLAKDVTLDNVDIEFVFSYLEEIKQVSATGIAMRGSTPFGTLDKNTAIIVLESATAKTTQTELLEQLKLKPANYEDGPLIRCNDRDIIYGQLSKGTNKIENLLLSVAKSANIKFQHTVLSGTCDATAYSLFTETPNIVGITIPTKNKHNWGTGGELVHEEVYVKDVAAVRKILELAIKDCATVNLDADFNYSSLSQRLKENAFAPSKVEIGKLKKDRIATYFHSLQRLKRAKYFPESFADSMYFAYGAGVGRIIRSLR